MSANLQEDFYDEDRDYASGSPHLEHPQLNRFLLKLIVTTAEAALERGLPAEILEIGGGDGAITEPLLARGLSVTSTEMSAASVARMKSRFGHNERFRAVHDPDGSLRALGNDRFSCVLFASVLHHIPDYLAALSASTAAHLRREGSLITIQDPLWYPRLPPSVRRASSGAYLSWRVLQGDLLRGLKTRLRRATRGYSDDEISDAVEYHVVRDGVDEQAIEHLLDPLFEEVEVHSYWSSQGGPQQRVGQLLRMRNTFAVVARGYRGATDSNSRSA